MEDGVNSCLVGLKAGLNAGSNAPYVDLSFKFIPAQQRHMEENNPVARHLKLKVGLVAASLSLFRFCE